MIVRAPDRTRELDELRQKLRIVRQIKPIVTISRQAAAVAEDNITDLEDELAGTLPGTVRYGEIMRRIENAYVRMPEGKEKAVAGKVIDKIRIREITMLSAEYDRIRVIDSERANAIRAEISGMLDTADPASALRTKVLDWMAKHPKE